MKRYISVILIILLMVNLIACQKQIINKEEPTEEIVYETSSAPTIETTAEPTETTTEVTTEPTTEPLVIQSDEVTGFDFSGSKNKFNQEKGNTTQQDITQNSKNVFTGNVLYDGEDFTITMSSMMGGLLYEGSFMVDNKTGKEIYSKNTTLDLLSSNIVSPFATFNGFAVNYSMQMQTDYVTEKDSLTRWNLVFNTKLFRMLGQEYIYDIEEITFPVIFYDKETDEEIFNQTFTLKNPDYQADTHPMLSGEAFDNNNNSIRFLGVVTPENAYRAGEGVSMLSENGIPAGFLLVVENNNEQDAYVYAPENVKINNKISCEASGMEGRIPAGHKVLKFLDLKAIDTEVEIPDLNNLETMTFDQIFTYDWDPNTEATVNNCSIKVKANLQSQIIETPIIPDIIADEDMVVSSN